MRGQVEIAINAVGGKIYAFLFFYLFLIIALNLALYVSNSYLPRSKNKYEYINRLFLKFDQEIDKDLLNRNISYKIAFIGLPMLFFIGIT